MSAVASDHNNYASACDQIFTVAGVLLLLLLLYRFVNLRKRADDKTLYV